MIPREILKKMRKIEIRKNRQLDDIFVEHLFQPKAQGVWISAWMINGKNANFVMFNRKINAVFEFRHPCLAYCRRKLTEYLRIALDSFKEVFQFLLEFGRQFRLMLRVPGNCFKIVRLRGRSEPNTPHFKPKRLRASSRTCSHGIPACGFLRNSSARRSSSAICSGESSSSNSPNSCRMVSTISCCSSNGNRLICSKISDALMFSRYHNHCGEQGDSIASPDVQRELHPAGSLIPHSASP